MHTDEDGTNLPISLARLKFLAHTGGTRTHARTHTWANRRRAYSTNTGSFSNFEAFNVIFVTHPAISEAVSDEAVAQLNLEVCLLISIWQKDYWKKLKESSTIQSKTALSLWLFRVKYLQCAVMQGNWVFKTLKDADSLRPHCTDNGFTNNSLITIFTLYNDVLWQMVYDHEKSFKRNMLVEMTLLRFRSVLGKWAPDSIAETTLFNVTIEPQKFCIICYVGPSMFMTANSSYVNLYVSFMTPGAHEMSGNAIFTFPGARAHAIDTTLRKKISF